MSYPASVDFQASAQPGLFPDERRAAAERAERNEITLYALDSIRGVGFATVRALCEEFRGDLSQVWTRKPEELLQVLYDARTPNPNAIVDTLATDQKTLIAEGRKRSRQKREEGVAVIFRGDDNYPPGLNELPSAPAWLFVQGDIEAIRSPFTVGVVGTRHPTDRGLLLTRRIASNLASHGIVVVSGLAEGIDAQSHLASLVRGAPTVAVLGHGIEEIFPVSTANVRQNIVRYGGAVVSEYLPRDTYSADRFVQRNRIQAALSRALCVVEAREKSGTAHTVRFARQLGRPLFGVIADGFQDTPEEELLHIIAREGGTIFDLARPDAEELLATFLHNAFTVEKMPRHDAFRLFTTIVEDIRSVASQFEATDDDFKFLLSKIRQIQRSLNKEIAN